MATLQPGEPSRMYALGKLARGGAVRGGYVDGRVYINHGGQQLGFGRTDPAVGVLIPSLAIVDILDEQPNTCRYRVHGMVPPSGVDVRITLGSMNRVEPLFAGHALTVAQTYAADNPQFPQADVTAVDYTWLFGNLLVTKYYRQQSASAIAADLVAVAAENGFTSTAVTPNLPVIDEMTITNENLAAAFTRLARRAGAHWYVDYQKQVHLFYTEAQYPDPEPLTPTHRSLADFRREQDSTQALTRVYVEGRGSTLVSPALPGEHKLPVVSTASFEVAADVFVKVSPPGSDGGAQLLDYTGVVAGGEGCLVGPGIGPSSALELLGVAGTGIETGTHSYAYTFVTTAGETRPSPLATTQLGPLPNPTVAATASFFQTATAEGNAMTIGDTVQFTYAYSTGAAGNPADQHAKQTLAAPISGTYVLPSNNDPFNPTMVAGINLRVPYATDARVTEIILYIYSHGVTHEWRAFSQAGHNNPAGGTATISIIGGTTYGLTGYPLPPTNTTAINAINVTKIALGGSGVTQRKVYRTAANLSQLKLLTTVADNTTTTYLDTTADSALGVNAPTGDTSGLQQPAGQVVPGDTELPVASTAPFEADGGWASIGNGEQDIRYFGLTDTKLTGIPTSGLGAITAAIAFNSTITATPMLTGIPLEGPRMIRAPLTKGDELYLVVQVDDTGRQAELAADVGGDGVREEWVQDRRLSIAEARARGQATLQVRPLDEARIAYTCRDLRTASGREITVNLPPPTNVTGTYKIQQVTIGNFRPYATQYPTFRVEASSNRFMFEDWLRVMRTKE